MNALTLPIALVVALLSGSTTVAQQANEDKAFKKAKSSGATYIIKREGENLIQKNLNTGDQKEISL